MGTAERPYIGADSASSSPEEAYAASAPLSHRKRWGQFFTPGPVAAFMVEWAVSDGCRSVLDPATGPGLFLELAAGRLPSDAALVGYEVDEALATICRARVHEATGRVPTVFCRDFLLHADGRYDAVVCNPPYLCHRDITYGRDLWRSIDALAGRRLSRLTNAYGLFLLTIAHRLSARGRAAIILPAEFLNADFAVPIKAHLLEANLLDGLLAFDHRGLIFSNAQTTACIILLRADRRPGEPVALAHLANADGLGCLAAELRSRVDDPGSRVRWLSPDRLDPRQKWEAIVAGESRCGSRQGMVPLGSLAWCQRGIATGANGYFTLTWAEVERRGLQTHVRPCITKAADVRAPVFTARELQQLKDKGRRAYLLSPTDEGDSAVRRYLAEGVSQGVHLRYLTSHKRPWWAPERREPAPILVTVFGRGRLRFVLNRAGALNLTAFHGIYPRDLTPSQVCALFAWLCTDACHQLMSGEIRRYGGGLLKLEPRDVERIPAPDVRLLSQRALQLLANAVDAAAAASDPTDAHRKLAAAWEAAT
jgi:adenine-specific DNA-methyltransferase